MPRRQPAASLALEAVANGSTARCERGAASGALHRFRRAEAELTAGLLEEPSVAGKALLRSALADVRARREALECPADQFAMTCVVVLPK